MPEVTGSANENGEVLLSITRTFAAPRDLVFRAWTEPQHLAKWWGPAGFTNPVCEVDARPGGDIWIVMRGPDGIDYPMSGTFQDFLAPERLVFTAVAEDADGNPLLESLTTVTFREEGGKTRVTVNARAAGIAAIAREMLRGMETGWSQSLDRLEETVASARLS